MKQMLFILAFFLSLTQLLCAQSEKYSVLNVAGQIKVKTSDNLLAKGDIISSEDQVVFMASNAMAAVFSPSKGRFTLKPKADQKGGSEYLAFVKNSIIPATQVLAAREVNVPGYVAPDLDDEICGGKLLVLPGTTVAATEAFALDESHFFFIRMEWAGQEISKRLSQSARTFNLDPKEILMVDEKSVSASELSNFRLFHYNAATKNATLVCPMAPQFPDVVEVEAEARILVEASRMNHLAENHIQEEVKGYLTDYYGHPTEAAFQAWYHAHFKP